MRKSKIIQILFIVIILLWTANIFTSVAQAVDIPEVKFKPSTTIPGSDFVADQEMTIDSSSLGKYIIAIYNYGIGLVSVLAVAMIMFGGYKWVFAAGNASRIGEAKSTIISALVGLVLALGSWMLLNTISPQLTIFKPLNVTEPKIVVAGCPGVIQTCNDFNNIDTETLSALTFGVDENGDVIKNVDDNGVLIKDRRDLCIDEATHANCGFPANVFCYWGTEDDLTDVDEGFCRSIVDKKCYTSGKTDSACDFTSQNGKQIYCETNNANRCSYGVPSSDCINNDECIDYCNTAGSNMCTKGQSGDRCWNDDECAEGFTCNDGWVSGGECVPS